MLGEVAGLRVLDAGCGTGHLSRALTRRGARVVGVDVAWLACCCESKSPFTRHVRCVRPPSRS
jgi:predicted RNA methylase